MKTNILVTGGAGYIGSITTKELIRSGYSVIVVDSLENGHRDAVAKEAQLEIADVGDKEKIGKILLAHKPSAIIDFAAYLAVGESMDNPKKYFANNVQNFINLLDTMVECDCKYLIKSSTASVYGNPLNNEDFPLKEEYTSVFKPKVSSLLSGHFEGRTLEGEDFFQKFIGLYDNICIERPELKLTAEEKTTLRIPTSIYGLSKLLDEIIMKKYDTLFGLKYITLRYFNVAGADPSGDMGEDKPSPTNLMTVTISQALGKKEKLQVFGNDYDTKDGTGIRDYIHVTDLAKGHLRALEYILTTKQSNTFNLGTGEGFTVFEVISAVEKASERKVKYEICERRSGDPTMSTADSSKANSLLKWRAQFSLDQMAASAWKWHSSHPNGYTK